MDTRIPRPLKPLPLTDEQLACACSAAILAGCPRESLASDPRMQGEALLNDVLWRSRRSNRFRGLAAESCSAHLACRVGYAVWAALTTELGRFEPRDRAPDDLDEVGFLSYATVAKTIHETQRFLLEVEAGAPLRACFWSDMSLGARMGMIWFYAGCMQDLPSPSGVYRRWRRAPVESPLFDPTILLCAGTAWPHMTGPEQRRFAVASALLKAFKPYCGPVAIAGPREPQAPQEDPRAATVPDARIADTIDRPERIRGHGSPRISPSEIEFKRKSKSPVDRAKQLMQELAMISAANNWTMLTAVETHQGEVDDDANVLMAFGGKTDRLMKIHYQLAKQIGRSMTADTARAAIHS